MTTSVGTHPLNSMWRKNPVPMCGCDIGGYCTSDLDEASKYDYQPHGMGQSLKPDVAFVEAMTSGGKKHCQSVQPSQCGQKIGYNTCLKCGADSAYDCEVCCPGLTKVNKGAFTWCSAGKPRPTGKCSASNPRACYTIRKNRCLVCVVVC